MPQAFRQLHSRGPDLVQVQDISELMMFLLISLGWKAILGSRDGSHQGEFPSSTEVSINPLLQYEN